MYMYMDPYPCTSMCAGGHVNEAVDWICNFRLGNVYIYTHTRDREAVQDRGYLLNSKMYSAKFIAVTEAH